MTDHPAARNHRLRVHVLLALVALAIFSVACSASPTTIRQTNQHAATDGSTAAGTAVPPEADPTESAETEVDDAPESVANERDPDGPDDPQAPIDIAPGSAEVRLIDAGAEPRTELRLMIAATCAEILTISQVQELNQTIDDEAVPSAGLVGNVMELATTAVQVGDNYEVRAEVVSALAAPGTPPALAASLEAELAKIVGLTSFATITNRGVQVPGSSRVEGAEALGPFADMVQSINQMQSPLPVEPVGVGARWETTSVIELQGVIIANITQTEVLAIDGTIVEMGITGSQRVELGSQMEMQGVTAEVVEWTSSTNGELLVDLATISPISSTALTVGSQQLDFGPGPRGGVLVQDIETEISVSSQPDDGCTGRTTRP